MLKIVMIAVGGGAGAILRYAIAGLGQRLSDGTFPIGTLLVNILGCFVIGFAGARFLGPHLLAEPYRLLLFVGLLGGFTTFSTFGWESFMLINDGQWMRAGLNILLSNVFGLAAVWIGYRLSERIFGV